MKKDNNRIRSDDYNVTGEINIDNDGDIAARIRFTGGRDATFRHRNQCMDVALFFVQLAGILPPPEKGEDRLATLRKDLANLVSELDKVLGLVEPHIKENDEADLWASLLHKRMLIKAGNEIMFGSKGIDDK